MCGIFGFTNWTQTSAEMFPTVASEMESRGGTSWGVTNGQTILKNMGPITSTLDNSFRGWDLRHGVIFHTRAPSAGTGRNIENAHPFCFDKILEQPDDAGFQLIKLVCGIHNGYVSTHHKLKTQYEDRKDFDVDSKHIFKHIIDELPLDELAGSGAISWYETTIKAHNNAEVEDEIESTHLYIARFDTDALHIGRMSGGELIFASTKSSIEKAARLACVKVTEWFTIEPRTKYEITLGENPQLVKLEEMAFGKGSTSYAGGMVDGRYQAPGESFFPQNHQNHHGSYQSGNANSLNLKERNDYAKCPGCSASIDPLTEALCDECFLMWLY